MERIVALESLRGLAALIVVFHHYLYAYFPAMVEGLGTTPVHSKLEGYVLYSPLNLFINGHFAVICFFVLSGFVLSFGYFLKGIDLVDAVIKRYFRLVPIVVVSVIFSYFLLKLGAYKNQEVAIITQSDWFSLFWTRDVTLPEALWEGVFGVFAIQPTVSSLNPVLWTIYYELIGSILIFAFMSLLGNDRRRWIVYPILIAILINTYYVGFVVGMILSDVFVRRNDLFDKFARIRKGYKVVLLLTFVYLGSIPAYVTKIDEIGLIHRPLILFNDYGLTKNLLYLASASIIITTLLTSRKVKRLFEIKPLVGLGGISYSIYATHLPLIGTTAGIFLLLLTYLPYNYAALVNFLIFIPLAIILAVIFRKYVDIPSIALSRWASKKVLHLSHAKSKAESRVEAIL